MWRCLCYAGVLVMGGLSSFNGGYFIKIVAIMSNKKKNPSLVGRAGERRRRKIFVELCFSIPFSQVLHQRFSTILD